MKYVFISYSRKDSELVDKVIEVVFAQFQMEVWIDKTSNESGRQWRESINNGILNASAFIACLSSNYFRNPKSYIVDELNIALNALPYKRKDEPWLIPVILGQYESSAVPSQFREQLEAIHTIDLTSWSPKTATELVNVLLPIVKPDIHWYYFLQRKLSEHIDSHIKHFSASGVNRFAQIENKWKSITEESVVRILSTLLMQTMDRAKFSGTHQTDQTIIKEKIVLFTYIPYLDMERFKQALQIHGGELTNRYLQFILELARNFRIMEGWKTRDIVHILYFSDGTDSVLDVLYLINSNLFMRMCGFLLEQRAPLILGQMYPTYITSALEYSELTNYLRREEANVQKDTS